MGCEDGFTPQGLQAAGAGGLNLTDMETCYKVFCREVLQGISLKSNRFGFEPEITAKVARGNWRIYEVPISYAGRSYEEGGNYLERWNSGLMVHHSLSNQG